MDIVKRGFTDEDIEFGKYYMLNTDNMYFSIDLQRSVKFNSPLVVKAISRSHPMCGTFKDSGSLWFGQLVDNGVTDMDTKNEIEFVATDVACEYQFKDKCPDIFSSINLLKI